MQYVFFEKKDIRTVQWGQGQSPQKLGNFQEFCVKCNLMICKITFNCELRKKMGGAGCTSCSPNNFIGEQMPPRGSRA